MTCEEALVLLSGHLDGQNTVDEEAQLQAHLSQCKDCRRLLDELQALDEALLSLEEAPPADLCETVMEAVRKEAPKRKKRRWVWPATAAAAALALLIGAGALAAPRTAVKEDAAPQLARMTVEETEPETASLQREASLAGAAADASSYSESEMEGVTLFTAAAPADSQAQALAEERSAPVVLLYTSLPELEGLPWEVLEDGSLLYTLEDSEQAEALWDAYPDDAVLYLPDTEASGISYALLLP